MSRSVGIVGCGWLGRALAESLIADGIRVVGTTTSPDNVETLRGIGIEPVAARFAPVPEGDLSALRDLDAIVVAIPPGRGTDAESEAFEIAGVIRSAQASHVVQISTSSVYPSSGGTVVEEDAIEDHRLVRVEDAFRTLERDVTILRCTGLFGAGRLILPFVLKAGRAVDPDGPVNLVERSDVVRAIRRVLDEPVSDTFNICADEHPTRGEFYRALAERTGLDVPRFRSSGEAWKIVDNRKFRERFGFRYDFPDPLTFPV